MRPKLPDGYVVEYRYETVLSKRPPKGEEHRVETLRTLALVGPIDSSWAEAEGEAILNPRDVFSLRIAKEIARGRAIKALADPRSPAQETVLSLARERFGSASIEWKNGRKPFVLIEGDPADDAQWEDLVDFYERLDQHGLRNVANVVLRTSSK